MRIRLQIGLGGQQGPKLTQERLELALRPQAVAQPSEPAVQMPDSWTEPPLFASFTTDRRPAVPALLSSLVGHVLVVALVLTVSSHVRAWFADDEEDWSRYKVETLRLHVSEPIFFSPNSPASSPMARPVEQGGGTGAAAASVAAGRKSLVPNRLQLPALRQTARNAPVILQPDFAPQNTPTPVVLPPVAFWARQAPDLPKPPAPGKEVSPGRTEVPAPAAQPAATPVLAVPNREPVVAEVNIAMPPKQTPAPPALPVVNSATVPVRLRDVTESHTASFEPMAGQAVNVLALAAERKDMRSVEIPKGLQSIPDTSAGDGAAPGTDSDAAVERRAKAGLAPSSQTKAGSGSSPESKNGNAGTGTAASAASNARGASPAGLTGAGAASSMTERGTNPANAADGGAATLALPTRAAGGRDVTRIEHSASGSFDVVIMQSAARDDLPDVRGMLSGNPVYTVYLRVGDRKEWLLEYCVPVRETAQSNPYQVNVEDAGSVTPPYPISTVIPNAILGQQQHIVVHGMLTATGSLRVTKVPDGPSPLMADLVSLLSQWQFRPALRNKRAIDVEVLLVIPPHA